MILEIERGSTRLHTVENSLWKRLWTCHNTEYVIMCIYTYIYIYIYTHTHIYIYTHIYIHTYTHIQSRILCIYIYMCVCVCVKFRDVAASCVIQPGGPRIGHSWYKQFSLRRRFAVANVVSAKKRAYIKLDREEVSSTLCHEVFWIVHFWVVTLFSLIGGQYSF